VDVAAVDAEEAGQVALRIEVHHENAVAEYRQPRTDVDDRSRLADAALLIEKRRRYR
jgi:hypothetical protein